MPQSGEQLSRRAGSFDRLDSCENVDQHLSIRPLTSAEAAQQRFDILVVRLVRCRHTVAPDSLERDRGLIGRDYDAGSGQPAPIGRRDEELFAEEGAQPFVTEARSVLGDVERERGRRSDVARRRSASHRRFDVESIELGEIELIEAEQAAQPIEERCRDLSTGCAVDPEVGQISVDHERRERNQFAIPRRKERCRGEQFTALGLDDQPVEHEIEPNIQRASPRRVLQMWMVSDRRGADIQKPQHRGSPRG